VLLCRLDCPFEHPEDRTGFHYHPLLDHVRAHRGELIGAVLTILRAFHLAGRPAHKRPPYGGFEQWDSLVRGALVWAGADDPLGNLEQIRRDVDEDLEVLAEALRCWDEQLTDRVVTSAEIALQCSVSADLKAAVMALAGCDERQFNARRIGMALGGVEGRVVDGRRLIKMKKGGLGNRWWLEHLPPEAAGSQSE
jgi:putative DNA primase/helicase